MAQKVKRMSLIAGCVLGLAAHSFYKQLREGSLGDYYWWPTMLTIVGIWLAIRASRMSRQAKQNE